MASLSAINSATPSLQASLTKSRLEQAQRDASRVEAYANDLQTQADNQGRVVEQAHQRVNSLKGGSNAAPSGSTSSAKNSSVNSSNASSETAPAQDSPTYSDTLAKVFQSAKSMLASDLTSTQKNVITGSLRQAANQSWSSEQTRTQAIQRYGNQVSASTSEVIGRAVNTTV